MHRLPRSSQGLKAQGKAVTIGLRAEDASRIWERRAPLTPDAVYELTSRYNAKVVVAPSAKRVFTDAEYQKAGAQLGSRVNSCNFVVGIKEPPISEAEGGASSTHFMFSHTAKGQPYNTPLLAQFVDRPPERLKEGDSASKINTILNTLTARNRPTLIDFELLTDADGKRTVGFGWYAGVAGVLESLSSMAHSHLEIGVASPFLYTPRPHTQSSLTELRKSLRKIGEAIAANGTPPQLGPFIFGLTGTGKVAEGCLSILSELPIEHVKVEDLPNIVNRNDKNALKKIYLVHAKPQDYFVRLDGQKYDRTHYYQSPQSYISVFADKIAPYLTLFLNGTGWSPSYPRLMSNEQLSVALARAANYRGARFTNIGDISCDVEGGLEFMTKATTLSSPYFKVRPPTLPTSLPSVQIMSVDILPASIPLDASRSFSDAFMPYLKAAINRQVNDEPYPEELQRAIIATNGELTEKHKWLLPSVHAYFEKLAQATETEGQMHEVSASVDSLATTSEDSLPKAVGGAPTKKHKILIMGSGMVAQPAVDLLAGKPDVELLIASNSLVELQALAAPHAHVKYRVIDVNDIKSYVGLIKESDVVVSLLPADMHPAIAEACIERRKHMVTASYVSPQMDALNNDALARDVLILNEIGLDPGIDHCSAMILLGRLKGQDQSVVSFTSFCGGLPAPDDSHVPLRYKFSWRPLGVLNAALNDAKYLLNNKNVRVPSEHLLSSYFPKLPITKDFELEGLPNRDSLKYISKYKLDADGTTDLATFVRGTLRYPGFSSLMGSFKKVGLLNNRDKMHLAGWETFFPQCLALMSRSNTLPPLSTLVSVEEISSLQEALQWLGLLRPPVFTEALQIRMPPLPSGELTPIEIFAYLLGHRLRYAPHERDMVVLSHEIITVDRTSQRRERTTSTLIAYGELPGDPHVKTRPASAMARTVGLPVALAALRVARGQVSIRGVASPLAKEIYNPLMESLSHRGISMVEKTIPIMQGSTTVEQTLLDADTLREEAAVEPVVDPNMHDLDQDEGWMREQENLPLR